MGPAPLSFSQQRLWLLDRLEPGSAAYHITSAVRLRGGLEAGALAAALAEVVRRHGALRTVFPAEADGDPVQVVRPAGEAGIGLPLVDLSGLRALAGSEAARWTAAEVRRPFDLERGPLLRVRLFRVAPGDHHLAVVLHHIVGDGWSLAILVRELVTLYGAFQAGRRSPLPELPVQYVDFARGQRRALSGERLERELAYWRERLRGLPPELPLPTDRPRPATPDARGGSRSHRLPASLADALRALARRRGTTPFVLTLAALQAFLGRHAGAAGGDDMAVGVPVSGRERPEVQELIGFFVSILVMRTDLSGDPPFLELLERARETALGAQAHQDVPFEKLVEDLQPERELGRNPFFRVMLAFQNTPREDPAASGLRVEAIPAAGGEVPFDLTLTVDDDGEGGLFAGWDYLRALFDAPTVSRLAERFQVFLEGVVAGPERRLSELPLLLPAERAQLLTEWNDTAAPPLAGTVLERIAAQAARTPDAAALDGAWGAVSYREMAGRLDAMAGRLRERGVGPEVRVGLCLERTPEALIAVLAVLRAGGCAVPLDPELPRERMALVLEDTGAALVLVGEATAGLVPDVAPVVRVEGLDAGEGASALPYPPPEAAAYIFYTSGSTGLPKGVVVSHASLLGLIAGFSERWGPRAGDRVLQFSSLGFDIFLEEALPAWVAGATVVQEEKDRMVSVLELPRTLERWRIGFLELPAGFWREWDEHLRRSGERPPAGLRIFVGSERVPPEPVRRWVDWGVEVVNAYGSTEATITCCLGLLRAEDGDRPDLPVGRLLPGARVYLLDGSLSPVPLGSPGEIAFGGWCPARGYHGRPGLTAERFVPDPFGALRGDPGARLYRTGDRGRFLPDGRLEVNGRVDRQVKIRGYRVEPGEVEAILAAHPAVGRAAIVLAPGAAGVPQLVAFAAARAEALPPPASAELLGWLRERLPEYLVPAAVVWLDRLPLNSLGKVDRRALPMPDLAAGETAAAGGGEPRNRTEKTLAGIWEEVLAPGRAASLRRDAHFFALGGHSLAATRVVSRVRQLFGVELPLRAVFEAPTLAGLAARVALALRGGAEGQVPPLVRRPAGSPPAPLSFAQQRLWLLQQLDPGSAAYNQPFVLRLAGPLDVPALAAAFAEVARRHEVLRTTFPAVAGEAVQSVAPPESVPPLALADLTALPQAWREREAARLVAETVWRPFDLARGPVLRLLLLRLSPAGDEHRLVAAVHHTATDGWSVTLLVREVGTLYEAFRQGRPAEAAGLPELPVQYSDYAAWQRSWLTGPVLEEQLAYWRGRLTGAPPDLELPADHPRPRGRRRRSAGEPTALPPDLARRLDELARRHEVTRFMVLLAALQVLLGRHTGQDDFTVGTGVANRGHLETEALIGFFTNTLVLRADLAGNPELPELLGRVRSQALGAFAHQDLPFERLVEELDPRRDLDRTPLFQVMFEYEEERGGLAVPGLAAREEPSGEGPARFDLTLSLVAGAAGYTGGWTYDRGLFDPTTVRRLAGHFLILLEGMTADPARRLSELPLLSEGEQAQLRVEWNDTAAPLPEVWAHEMAAAWARRAPEAVAVEGAGRRLTYGELEAAAEDLAARLRALGAGPDARVALCLDRTPRMALAIYAVLKAGAAHVPLDPSYPRERLAWMLEDSGARLVVTEEAVAAALPQTDLPRIDLGLPGKDIKDNKDSKDRLSVLVVLDVPAVLSPRVEGAIRPDGDNLAYITYTSGSTGRPKGVLVTHRGLANVLRSLQARPGYGPETTAVGVASLSFDVATWEILTALSSGGRIVLAGRDEILDGARLAALLAAVRPAVLQATPTTWRMLLDAGWTGAPGLRAQSGAEELPPSLAAELAARCAAVWNLYGPTEVTVWSNGARVDPAELTEGRRVSLGRPIPNVRLHVADRHGAPVPPGVPGELWIGGAGVARGYLNRPDLTADRFVPDALSGEAGARLYRSGDRVRQLAGGAGMGVEFLGRLDHQVKIRGYRIELGEVESALATHPAVSRAAVLAFPDGPGLVAYAAAVAGLPGETLTPEGLREHLAGRLPGYMVPAVYVILPALPLNANGKIDRRALPAPAVSSGAAQAAEMPESPWSDVEAAVAGIWAEVLGLPQVRPGDDFFALGGHSLLANRAVARLRSLFGVDLPLRSLFEAPTVAGLAREVERELRRGRPGQPPLVAEGVATAPLSFAQQRLWILDQIEPGAAYNMPVALRLSGPLDVPALAAVLAEIARRQGALRTSFPLVDGEPAQVVAPPGTVPLPLADLSALPAGRRQGELAALAAAEAARPFDLARGPVWRALLLRLEADDHAAVATVHHIASDGASMEILLRELVALYPAFHAGLPSPLPEPAVQYADFALWQRRWLSEEILAGELEYWRRQLAGLPGRLDLPADRPLPAVRTFAGAVRDLVLPADRTAALGRLARGRGATLFMAVLAAFQALLARLSGAGDLAVGVPVSGRNRSEIENVIGLFVNTLVLRGDLRGDPTFPELLARTREATLAARTHGDLPFERLVEALQPERDLARSPLFQVMLSFQEGVARLSDLAPPGGAAPATQAGEMEIAQMGFPWRAARFDLTLFVEERGGLLVTAWEHSTELFDGATIDRLARRFAGLLASLTERPEERLSELPLLLPEEAAQLRVEWNRTAEPLPEVTVPGLIAEQARRTPGAVAIEGIDGRLTYAELDRAAAGLAARLHDLGAGPGSLVGLAVDRSARMVVALLGILKSGAAYVPLDPAYPRERLALMVEDSGVGLILTDRASFSSLPPSRARLLVLDEEDLSAAGSAPAVPLPGDSLAYVIYTSGSTGRPKGVMLPHRALANFVLTMARRPGFAAGETLVAVTSLSFDIAGLEIYLPLITGGRVVVASRAETMDAFALGRRVSEKELGAGVLQATPSTWRMLVEAGWKNPRLRAFCGGEALPPDLAAALVPRCAEVWNLYGPTETTIWSTAGRVAAGEPVSIGGPIGNTRVFVADAWGALAPVGIPGELLIGGAGLARGYRGNPAQTAERFVPDPFSGLAGERLYRTGDLARWRAGKDGKDFKDGKDGRLECFGRLDHQIKVRGFRVEPGEIEAALAEHPGVRQAVVVTRPDPAGGSRLAAYVVPGSPAPEEAVLRGFLGGRLPAYMVPSLFVFLPALPLTPNGKVDRRALPAAEPAGPAPSRPPRPPETEDEKAIAGVWAEVLGLAEVGAEDSFFALGGHSLLANRVMVRLRRLFGLDLPLRAMFEAPTVAALAAAVAEARQGAGDAGDAGEMQLTARPRERHRMRRTDLEAGS